MCMLPSDSEATLDGGFDDSPEAIKRRGEPQVLRIAKTYGHDAIRYKPAIVTNVPIEWEPPKGVPTEIEHVPQEGLLLDLWDSKGSFREAFLIWSDAVLSHSAWREYGWLEPEEQFETIYPDTFRIWLVEQRWKGRSHDEIRAHAAQEWPCLPLPSTKSGLSRLISEGVAITGREPPRSHNRSYAAVPFPESARNYVREYRGTMRTDLLIDRVYDQWGHLAPVKKPTRWKNEPLGAFQSRQHKFLDERVMGVD